MAADLLNISDLTLHYGGSQILNGVDITAREGQVTCVMGTNGVGKTSLLKAISGTHPRSGGDYVLTGEEIGNTTSFELARKGVAYVPQGREIFPFLTVRENLETGFACLPRSDHTIPDYIFDLFPILKEFLSRRGGDLSGGQQQQLAIARALITKPKLLLLDEPTEGIQPNIIKQIGEVIRLLRDQGEMAIILVEQFFEFAYSLGDEFLVLERGTPLLRGSKCQIGKEQLRSAVSV
ncbi:urea ABC transporter ATP-binding subunit UrtE [Ruegeria sp. HKCCD6428]|uniref:urea ABC transporter ATP-binding subunit UrtE n=1 Tax=Ruegeria sp. HKCCD6428 TaxID=2683002 RepID=UPI0014922C41|nr:urea ABC transporter ATP-binding subunit UrtE [Ruegeria sp. HKCCD6428]NOC85916.1 urea ABC transporter ATP-binding subunit UrtE [Ruegeria sp. HKCCD6428]